MRGFKVCKGFEDANINLPYRATLHSAGYDIESAEDILIPKNSIVLVKTGFKVYMQEDEVFLIYPRSSLSVKKGLTIPNNVGVIDKDYYENPNNDGHVFVAIYNFSNEDKLISKGERIAQGIFQKFLKADIDNTTGNIRTGGFGSTK